MVDSATTAPHLTLLARGSESPPRAEPGRASGRQNPRRWGIHRRGELAPIPSLPLLRPSS